jgi:hypothetical protein
MNNKLFYVLSGHAEWLTQRFGATRPAHYLFPFGKPAPVDPTCPTTTLTTVWVSCRLHNLGPTAATKMAEGGAPESTMLSILGHMRRAMLERYSHICVAAKREAVESLTAGSSRSNGYPKFYPSQSKRGSSITP